MTLRTVLSPYVSDLLLFVAIFLFAQARVNDIVALNCTNELVNNSVTLQRGRDLIWEAIDWSGERLL